MAKMKKNPYGMSRKQYELWYADRTSTLRGVVKYLAKSAETEAEKEAVNDLSNALRYKRRLSDAEYDMLHEVYNQLKTQIYDRRYKEAQREWRKKQRESMFRLEQKIAKREQAKVNRGKYGAEKYHKDYTGEDLEELRLNFLGIGKNGIKLSDNTIFTEDDFKTALEKNNISIDRFFDTEMDILNIKYNPTRYNRWKQSIESELKRLIDSENLTPREKEGIERMTKMYGIFNSVRSEIY